MPGFGDTIHRFETLDTTMREAADRARAGETEGTVVTATEQTQGRGRQQRHWHSPPGAGLYFSLILRPAMPPPQLPILTMAMGVGVARGLGEATGVRCDLRWPNDVLIGEKKCVGILTELATTGQETDFAIVGVGINLGHESFPAEIAPIATSIRIETGAEFHPDAVLTAVLAQMEKQYAAFLDRGVEAAIDAFTRISSYARGKNVIVEGTDLRGVTAGIAPNGSLLLRTPDGSLTPLLAGGVRPA